MPVLVAPSGKEVVSLEKQLEVLDKEIEAIKRRKLITIVGSNLPSELVRLGPSDKVLYVEPYDLKGHDPEELVEIIEEYVIETKWDNGFAQHITGKRPTGELKKRYQIDQKYKGPFGPTYRIDTSNTNGQAEALQFLREVELHTSRTNKVPQPVPFHSEVDNNGNYDLKTPSLNKEDVPVATLENYQPLEKLLKQRDALIDKINDQKLTEASKPVVETPEVVETPVEKESSVTCPVCSKTFSDNRGLAAHKRFNHKEA